MRRDLAEVDSTEFVKALLDLVHEHAGMPIVLIEVNGCPQIGVMAILPEPDDWFLNPIDVAEFVAMVTE